MILRRGRFRDLVDRQLELVLAAAPELLADVAAARRAYDEASREEAEERFGDYQLALAALKERLLEARDAYAATLDEPDAYEREFERAAARRWPDIRAV